MSVVRRDRSERDRVVDDHRWARPDPAKEGAERTAAVAALGELDEPGAGAASEPGTRGAEFSAIVAHELASPIAAIRFLARMLMVGGLLPEEQTNALAAICTETDVLQALIRDVECAVGAACDDFTVRPRPSAIADLVAEPITFARTLPGEHPLTVRIDSDADPVLADPHRIRQVLRNLIGNAAKYSPPEAPIELRATRRWDRVRIEVADRGPGIHPDDAARIFEKFERGRAESGQRVPGLGLGLYVSRQLVRGHGSDLNVESRPDGGSVFSFDLEVAR